MTKKQLYTIILGLITSIAAVATPYCDIRKFSITDGLAANSISDMKQSYDRLMWFSTWNGLSYYDGYTFHTFRDEPDQTDLLSTNRIMSIEPTMQNNIWCITTDRKLYVYDTHACQFISLGDDINKKFGIDLRTEKIYPIKNGNTWITSNNADYIIRATGPDVSDKNPELIRVGEQGLRSGNVWFIWQDHKNREWILTDKGATIYNNHFSTSIPFKWIREVGESIFLATTDGKLAVYDDRNKLSMIPMPAGVTRINQLKNTGYQLLIATNLGMVIYNPRTFKTELINVQSPSQPMAEVKNMYTDFYGMVWVFTDGMGVTLVDPRTGNKQWLYADQEDPTDRTSSDHYFITQDENKTLWVVPNMGTFSYFDRKTGKLVPYLLRSNSSGNFRIPTISKFFLSDQGILWVTGNHDLTQIAFKDHSYTLTTLDHGEAEVRALCTSADGLNWTGYANGIIQVSDEQHQKIGYLAPGGQIVPEQIPFSESGIYSLFVDRKGRAWIGTNGQGLFLKDVNGTITNYKHDPSNRFSLPGNRVEDITSDRHGRLWIGTYGGGLALLNEGATGYSFSSITSGMPWPKTNFSKVRRINCSPTGEILVGTTDGLISFSDTFRDPRKIKFYVTTYIPQDTLSLAANDVNFILLHSNGNTYISELGGILEKIRGKNLLKDSLKTDYFKNLNLNEGIVQSMVEDNQGNLWVVRESSIDRCNLKTGATQVFGPNDFDFNMSFSEARPVHDPATNNITVGTPMGSLTFNPATLKKSQYQPQIIFTALHFNGESQSIPILHTEKLTIPANKRNLTISFAALDYSRKYQMQYQYRVEGSTPPGEWIPLGSSNIIGFNRIAHGDYVLKVKATNAHGVWSKYIGELPIEVRPTFWESIWGRMLLMLMLIGVVGAIFYTYNQRQRQNMTHEMSVMKNQFFSDAAHRLRTPLTLIGGPVHEVLDNEQTLSSKSRELLGIVERNARDMLEMINKMLRFDNDDNFYTDGGIDENTEENQATKEANGQIDDKNVAKYLEKMQAERRKAEEDRSEIEEDPQPVAKDITLLVVEDNNDLRNYLYSILVDTYNVLLAENGKAGLLLARKEMPDFILTDVTMPVMDGITMIHQIKQDSTIAHIPIIILSAKASVADQLKGFEEGVDGYLTKPFSSAYLLGRIEAVINQRRAIQAEVIKQLKEAGDKDAIAAYHILPALKPQEPKPTAEDNTPEAREKEQAQEFAFMSSQINDKTTEKIMRYVTENMSNPDLKIDGIADAMGMSRSVLYGRIKQAVGMTPIDFVRHIRIMKATEMLQNTNDTMANIAYNVGFTDPKYFSKVFKKEMGIIPSEYRQRTQR